MAAKVALELQGETDTIKHRTMKYRSVVIGAALWLMGLLVAAAADEVSLPQIYCFPVRDLVKAKQLIAQHDPAAKTPYAALLKYANAALWAKPESVMDKPLVAASGNKHDFFSYGPYWWPDPKKPDGLPYIKRDGYVNPKSKIGTDSNNFGHTCMNAEILAYTYYFTSREIYAAKAAQLIRVWFLDPATAMNPSANYGQAIPGVIAGRGEGVIEMRNLTRISDIVALIESSKAWTQDDRSAFRHWLEQYDDWLTHTKQSIDETSLENNHMSWRDVQLVQFSLVLGKPDQARALLQQEMSRLLDMQVKSQGEQDRELVRADSLSYSLFNLEALFRLAVLGDYVGVNCWKITAKDGGGLQAALDYLAPYADPGLRWPQDEVKPTDRKRLLPLLAQAYAQTKDPKYKKLLDKFCGDGPDLWRLIWRHDGTGSINDQAKISPPSVPSDPDGVISAGSRQSGLKNVAAVFPFMSF
ncbi:MAG TPA: alginate lyase family protein [Opitutaceae bacterium]|nr:alginate lyase family protein [Opitutaceae bacterium]